MVQPGRTILLCVYDKLALPGAFPAHGFLGASVFEPPLNPDPGDDGLGLDVWVPCVFSCLVEIGVGLLADRARSVWPGWRARWIRV